MGSINLNRRFSENAANLDFERDSDGLRIIDKGGILSSRIVFDHLGDKSGGRPLAFVIKREGQSVSVEPVDILKSIEKNPDSIRHPIISYAVSCWRQIACYPDPRLSDRFVDQQELISAACRNLKRVNETISRSQRIPLYNELQKLSQIDDDLLDKRTNYLRLAWDRLSLRHVDETLNLDERVAKIREYLKLVPTVLADSSVPPKGSTSWNTKHGQAQTKPSLESVIRFLKSDGSRFVFNEDPDDVRIVRPRWVVFKRAFLSWKLGLKPGTLTEYYKRISSQPMQPSKRLDLSSRDLSSIIVENITAVSIELQLFGVPFSCPYPKSQTLLSLHSELKRAMQKNR